MSSSQLLFSDEFDSFNVWNGTSGWDTGYSWSPPSGTIKGDEKQFYIQEGYAPTDHINPWSARNGILSLTAQKTTSVDAALVGNMPYTSGMISSFDQFTRTYGYFEIKAQVPAGQGLWPAFWLLPADGSWPPEIDVMEVLGHDTTTLHTAIHSGTAGSVISSGNAISVADMSDGYHTYGVDWQADTITWYFDGQQVFQAATPADMHEPMYMIANLAVGGAWPGSPDSSTPFPSSLNIDYIKVWDVRPDGTSVPAIPAPAPIPVPANETFVFTSNSQADAAIIGNWRKGNKIDLSAIDADTLQYGEQAFRLVSSFTKHGDELRFVQDKSAGVTHIYGNTDHDKSAEFEITVRGLHKFSTTDFIL